MSRINVTTKLTIALSGLLALPAYAADLNLSVEIPRMNAAEYHRPYVAVWVEGADQEVVANLSLWYRANGTKWLPDLRQWWRKTGRTLKVPVDGVSGPTRPVGKHALKFGDRQSELSKLAPGSYALVVEAVREVGGRELVKIPFTWPAKASQSGKVQGNSELGAVTLAIKP